ncbi:MAG: hypothetical protein HWE26_22630 [Alteromonadaceae bacterium]|nr:hypothetical protein [Alteromonadaceae bacterium]
MTSFSNCHGILEISIFLISVLSILIIIISGVVLFSGEKIEDSKGAWFTELLGPLHPLFTSKYLVPSAAKWRYPFFGSIVTLIVCYVLFANAGICSFGT